MRSKGAYPKGLDRGFVFPALLALLWALAWTLVWAPASAADTFEVQMRRAPLGDTGPVDAWLASHPRAQPSEVANVYGALCEIQGRAGRYRAAAAACARMLELQGRRANLSSRQALNLWRTLADTPAIAVRGTVDVALTYGWTGVAEVPVEVGEASRQESRQGSRQGSSPGSSEANGSWGVDSGAEISTMSATDARRYRVRMLNEALQVEGATPGAASGHLGVIDHMRVGDAQIEHLPVLVLPDAALTFDGRKVPPLLGAPILYAFGRVEFADHGRRLRLGPAQAAPMPGQMIWTDAGLAIELGLARGRAQAHLDTGANVSELHLSTRALLTSVQRSRLTLFSGRLAGVSGQIEQRLWRSPPLDIALGGGSCRVDSLNFGSETAGVQGRVGIDLVKSCANFAFDVSTMTFAARGG